MNMEIHTRAFGFSKSGMILLKIQSYPSALVYLCGCLSSNGKLQKGNARNVKNGAPFANLRFFVFILLVSTNVDLFCVYANHCDHTYASSFSTA